MSVRPEQPGFAAGLPRLLIPLTIITGITWATLQPILHSGFTQFTWDAILHAHWNSLFVKQFWAGELYPRWLAGMNEGLGSPVFFYYPPLPYWVSALWSAILPGDEFGLHSLALSLATAQWLSGVGCYWWLAARTPQWCAIFGAVVFMLLPYHLEIDLYQRGAVAEFWAFAWLPWVASTLSKVQWGNPRSMAACSCAYAALICTHLLTTLLFTPCLLGYALYLKLSGKVDRFIPILGTLGCGFGLAAIYWMPAMLMQDYSSFEYLTRHLYYTNAFLSTDMTSWRWNAGTLYQQIGGSVSVALILGLLSVVTVFAAKSQARTFVNEAMFWWSIAVLSAAMMFSMSDFIWRLFPTLQIVQFPWRWGTVLCLSVAFLCGFGLRALCELRGIRRGLASALFSVSIVALFYQSISAAGRNSERVSSAERTLRYRVDAPEYRPRWARSEESLGDIPPQDLMPEGSVKSQSWFGRRGHVVISTPQAGTVALRHFYFPGWKAEGENLSFRTKPHLPDGLLCLDVPAGQWKIDLVLGSSLSERFGCAISVCSMGLVIGLLVWRRDGKSAKRISE